MTIKPLLLMALLLLFWPTCFAVELPLYELYPRAGHRVDVIALHPSDKNAPFIKELQSLKLLLMEPGIYRNETLSTATETWYRGRVFILSGRTARYGWRGVIEIEGGQFR